jgi:(p)ppGpp synthase/HD superfamily hydrolase
MKRAYSDLVNHAFAYASLHPPGKMRKGTRVPYITHPANLAVILARYGCDEETIAAGILHDVVEDCEEPGHTRTGHLQKIEEKFGADVRSAVETVTHQETDEDGRKLGRAERDAGYLASLGEGDERALWVCAADKLHNSRAILSDLDRTEDSAAFWARFSIGPEESIRWYRRVLERLRELGFDAPIVSELAEAVEALEGCVPSRGSLTATSDA